MVNSYEATRKRLGDITEDVISRMDKLIEDFAEEVNDILTTNSPTDPNAPYEARALPSVSNSIRRAREEFRQRGTGFILRELPDAFHLGGNVTVNAMSDAGIEVVAPAVSPRLLVTVSRETVNIFEEATDELVKQIMSRVSQSALGNVPTSRLKMEIEDMIAGSREVARGVQRRIGFNFQAEAIARTELGTIYSSAQQAVSEDLESTLPDLRKSWVTGGARKRRGHLEVEAETRKGIPIKDKFVVRDYTRTGVTNFLTIGGKHSPKGRRTPGQRVINVPTYTRRGSIITDRMLFPRDPAASAGNRVNCKCIVMEVLPAIEDTVERLAGRVRFGEES